MKRSGGISAVGGGSNVRGMTALSIHAPKPVQTSSLKKENGGQDVNLAIVKGKVGWASAPTVPPPGTSALTTTGNDPPEQSLHNKQSSQTTISSDGNEKYQHQHHLDQNSPWSVHAGGQAHHSESSHHDMGENQQHPSQSSSSTVRASRWGNVNLDSSIDNLPTHHYPSRHHHYDDHQHNSAGYPRYNDDNVPSRPYGSSSGSPNRRRGSGNSGYYSYGCGKDDYPHRDHNYRGGDSRIGGGEDYLHRDHGRHNNYDRDDDGGRYSNFHHRSDNRDRGGGYDHHRNNTDDHSHGSHDNVYNRYHSSSSSWGERRNNNASTPLHPPSPTRNEHSPSSPISHNQHQLPEKSEEDIILQAVREREAAEVRAKLKKEQQRAKELKEKQQQPQKEKENENENGEKGQSKEVSSSHGTPELEDQEHTSGSEEDGEEEEEEEEEESEHHLRWGDIDDDDDSDESCSESSESSDRDGHSFQNDYHDDGHLVHAKYDAAAHRSHTASRASSGDNEQHHLNWRAEALHNSGPAGNGGFRNYTIASNRRQQHNYQQHYPSYEHPPRSPPRQEQTNYQIYKRPSSPPRHPSHTNEESDRSAKFHQEQQQHHETLESRSREADTTTTEDQQEKVEQQQRIEEVLSEEEIERRRKVLLEQQQQNILREVAAKRNAVASKKKPKKENQSMNSKRTEHIPGFEGSRPIAPEDEEAKAARLEYARTRGPRTKGMLFLRLDDGTLARKEKDGTLVPKEMQVCNEGKRRGKDGKTRGKPNQTNEKQLSESHGVTEDREDHATTNNDETKVVPAPVPAVSAWKFGPPQGIVTNEEEGLPDTNGDSGNHHKDDVDPSSLGCNANAPSWNPSEREEMDSEQKKFAAVAPIMGSWDNFVSRAPGLDEEQQHWDEHHPHEDSHESFPDPHAAVPHDLFSSGDETGKTDRRGSGGGGHKQFGKSRKLPPRSSKSDGKKKTGTASKRPYNPKNKKRSGPSYRSKDGKDYTHDKDRSEAVNAPLGSSPDMHQRSSKKDPQSSRKNSKRSLEGKKNQILRSGAGGSNKSGGAKQGQHENRKKGSRPKNNNTKPRKPRTQHVAADVDNAVRGDAAS